MKFETWMGRARQYAVDTDDASAYDLLDVVALRDFFDDEMHPTTQRTCSYRRPDMRYLTLDQSVGQSNIECRLMKLGQPMDRGPFQFKALYLVTHTRMEGFLFSREAVIDAIHIASGQKITFSGIGPEFALTLFSNKKF